MYKRQLRKSRVAGLPVDTFHWLLDHSIGFNRFVMNQLNERLAQFIATIRERLAKFQDALLAAARQRLKDRSVMLDTWDEFLKTFAGEQSSFAWCHWDGTRETEARIKEQTRATIRCIPLPGQGPAAEPGQCIVTGKPSAQRVLIAKAY